VSDFIKTKKVKDRISYWYSGFLLHKYHANENEIALPLRMICIHFKLVHFVSQSFTIK